MNAQPPDQIPFDPSDSDEPGVRHRDRRALVVALLVICGVLCGFPGSLQGTGIVLVVGLVVIDVALIRATGGLAFRGERSLDERQTALRNLAHRLGFRLLGLALVLAFVMWVPGSAIAAWNAGLPLQVDSGVSGRFIVSVLELVAMMPTMVIAWMEPGVPPAARRRSTFAVPAVAASVTVLAWVLLLVLVPAQNVPANGNTVDLISSGATCRHFAAGRMIGAGLGATVGTHVEVCWNGRQAFVVGGGSRAVGHLGRLSGDRDLSACGADSWGDFALVSGLTCTTRITSDGTLHYAFQALVSPLPFTIGARQVSMSLVVTRSGRVLVPL